MSWPGLGTPAPDSRRVLLPGAGCRPAGRPGSPRPRHGQRRHHRPSTGCGSRSSGRRGSDWLPGVRSPRSTPGCWRCRFSALADERHGGVADEAGIIAPSRRITCHPPAPPAPAAAASAKAVAAGAPARKATITVTTMIRAVTGVMPARRRTPRRRGARDPAERLWRAARAASASASISRRRCCARAVVMVGLVNMVRVPFWTDLHWAAPQCFLDFL